MNAICANQYPLDATRDFTLEWIHIFPSWTYFHCSPLNLRYLHLRHADDVLQRQSWVLWFSRCCFEEAMRCRAQRLRPTEARSNDANSQQRLSRPGRVREEREHSLSRVPTPLLVFVSPFYRPIHSRHGVWSWKCALPSACVSWAIPVERAARVRAWVGLSRDAWFCGRFLLRARRRRRRWRESTQCLVIALEWRWAT